MNLLFELGKIKVEIEKLENSLTNEKNISVFMLRLDKIHPMVSGNKYFKLYYFLKKAKLSNKKIITFGGAYSNHLAAAAYACKELKIPCIGIVRGEETQKLSPTLSECRKNLMHVKFVSREDYKTKDSTLFKRKLTQEFGNHVLIPEGGFSKMGVRGAGLITKLFNKKNYTHVCCAVGTTTTLAGLINSCNATQTVLGFSALKNKNDLVKRLDLLLNPSLSKKIFLLNEYHFGGFGKKNNKLIVFMNNFYAEFGIPTDFVYSAKMMYGVFDLIKKKFFNSGSNILCIHTGGLQGNHSLPAGTLNFDFP